MEKPMDGFDYLAQLRKENGKQVQSFQAFSEYLEIKAREKGVPISGQFELTPLCNLGCKMCYVHLIPEQLKGHSVLPASVWKDLMHQAYKAGMISATLTGGECLAYPGFDELYLYLQSLGCGVAVLTNGVLLDEKRIQFFKEHGPDAVQITLYGWNDDVYERVTGQRVFGKVTQNIRNAVEAGLPVGITVTPSVYLGEDVLETIRTAKSLCGDVVVSSGLFSPREETGRSEQFDESDVDLYARIYRLLDQLDGRESREISPDQLPEPGGPEHVCAECGLRCGGGRSTFVMDWKGNVKACNRLCAVEGHALEEGFDSAWARVNRWANEWPRVPECKDCAYEGICDNCAGKILEYAEPGKQPMGLCERTKYLVQKGVRHIPGCE